MADPEATRPRAALERLIGWTLLLLGAASRCLAAAPVEAAVPRYEHIFIIIAENRDAASILGPDSPAPRLRRLAGEYALAQNFYGEVHPSEGNYVAMLAGSTWGIHDDDPWYCHPGSTERACAHAGAGDYADHTVHARTLVDQLEEHHLSWKAYMESLPAPGSLAVFWPAPERPVPGVPSALYAAKHNGFVNSARVQRDPRRGEHIVGFDQLEADLASGRMPNYAHIVPNQCNDMHGLRGAYVPADCRPERPARLIARGDAVIGALVDRIMRSSVWAAAANAAIVITFDEGEYGDLGAPQGCCGFEPGSPANFGGGRIATIVITNHGRRGVVDQHPYNHYSLLRTTERAFGIEEYLGHAADVQAGVVTMAPLFATPTGR